MCEQVVCEQGVCVCVCVCLNPASNMQVQINLSIFRSSDFRKL